MNPFFTILRHEARRLTRDRATPALVLLFSGLCLYAAWNGQRWAEQRQTALHQIEADLQASREEARERMATPPAGTPPRHHSPGVIAASVWYQPTLPVIPLAPLAIGQADGYPFDVRFHPGNLRTLLQPREASLDHPVELAAGRFDLAFVVVYLLPVFLFALTYDLWITEREQGTARLLFAQPVAPATFFLGKAIVHGGALLCGFVTVLGLSLIAFAGIDGLSWTSLATAAGTILLYGAFWIVAALAVNVYVRHAAGAALACGAIWLGVTALVPALLVAAVDTLHPVPSNPAYANNLRLMEQERQRARAQAAASVPRPGAEREDRVTALRAMLVRVAEDLEHLAPLRAAYQSEEQSRRQFAQAVRLASPATAMQDTLERLAGTDASRAIAFQQQAWSFAGSLRPYIEQTLQEEPEEPLAALFARVPEFRFHEPTGPERTAPLAANAAVLFGLTATLALAVGFGLRRRILLRDVL